MQDKIPMKTQMEIYNNLYRSKKKELIIMKYDKDSASRKANLYAIHNTWEAYNDQFRQK